MSFITNVLIPTVVYGLVVWLVWQLFIRPPLLLILRLVFRCSQIGQATRSARPSLLRRMIIDTKARRLTRPDRARPRGFRSRRDDELDDLLRREAEYRPTPLSRELTKTILWLLWAMGHIGVDARQLAEAATDTNRDTYHRPLARLRILVDRLAAEGVDGSPEATAWLMTLSAELHDRMGANK